LTVPVEFGHVSWCPPFQGGALAAEDEALGFDIRYFGENTAFAADPLAELRDAARATTSIKLATGSTNTVTRHPAVVAGGIAAVQALSGGRAICGVSTGDSAMGVLGRGPQRIAEFRERTAMLRSYLHDEAVRIGDWDSRIEWLAGVDYTPVPLEIMCSAPRAIGVAASLADRITLAVGTAPERVRWALERVDEGLAAAGRTRADVRLGMYVPLCVEDDRAVAAERLRVRVKGIAHMGSFPGVDLDEQPEQLRRVSSTLRTEYDYRHHNVDAGNPLAQLVEPEFADWFGIGGPAAYVVERLGALVDCGFSYFFVAGFPYPERERFAAEVMPQLRR
jgi:5,10-methylenetetrahydromethanopterin reductase